VIKLKVYTHKFLSAEHLHTTCLTQSQDICILQSGNLFSCNAQVLFSHCKIYKQATATATATNQSIFLVHHRHLYIIRILQM